MSKFKSETYPRFQDIQIIHFDGYDPGKTLVKVLEFFNDPAHAEYRLLDTHINYLLPIDPKHPSYDDPECGFWVEVTIIYFIPL